MKEWTRDNRIFSCGIDVLAHTPNPRCDTHKEYSHLPSHQDEGAHKESPFTISGVVELKPRTNFFFGLPQPIGKLRKKYPHHQYRLGDANHQE